MSGCCAAGATGRHLTPWTCFERGLKTRRQPPLAVQGDPVAAEDGRWVRFSVQPDAGRVQALRFACAHCATLIACCQALVELNRGCALQTPCVPEAAQLRARLPGLPASKGACAVLACAALRSALAAAGAPSSSFRESA